MTRGKLITFEGGEGSGKSTQVVLLAESFAKAGIKAIKTREPGGVDSAERIREILVKGDAALNPVTEILLNFAARSEHLQKLMLPELAAGNYVICDRFVDSTMAYQGFGHGVSAAYIEIFKNLVVGNFTPDLTILLDVDVEEGLSRASSRGDKENRFEKMGKDFHRRLRDGFIEIAKKEPERFAVIDAAKPKEIVRKKVLEAVNKKLGISL